MKSRYLILFLSIFILSAGLTEANAQSRKSRGKSKVDRAFDNDGNFIDKLWFGGMLTPSFNGNGEVNQFAVGFAPMVGYKITDKLSIGPRINLNYTHIRGTGFDGFNLETFRANLLSNSFAVFGRYKILPAIFAHVEFENQTLENYYVSQIQTIGGFFTQVARLDPSSKELLTEKTKRNNGYVGLGYTTTGGLLNSEISVLYNFLEDPNSIRLPFEFRFGLNYNF